MTGKAASEAAGSKRKAPDSAGAGVARLPGHSQSPPCPLMLLTKAVLQLML